ncbi:MAG TPA: hypothetical protein DDW17_02595 [Deltaproteobacteria bacterium]|nr:hypothetical protein [Deltaproteobacteria bacterium]
MGDYDDERPSWRDIDRKKDRSRHYGRQEKTAKKEGPKNRWQEGRVKEALDRLFMGDKGTPEHDKLYKKLHSTYGTESFLPTVTKYLTKYGLPDDVGTLILILDTKEEGIIFSVFEMFKEIYSALSPRYKEDIRRKLSIMSLTDKSIKIREKAQEILNLIEQNLENRSQNTGDRN